MIIIVFVLIRGQQQIIYSFLGAIIIIITFNFVCWTRYLGTGQSSVQFMRFVNLCFVSKVDFSRIKNRVCQSPLGGALCSVLTVMSHIKEYRIVLQNIIVIEFTPIWVIIYSKSVRKHSVVNNKQRTVNIWSKLRSFQRPLNRFSSHVTK